jgi:hypothetical protein
VLAQPAGASCQASTQCKELRCTAESGLVVQSCYGLCTPNERTLLGAQFQGGLINVQLNTRAAPASFPCAQVFDAATQQKLGASAFCEVDGTVLNVGLTSESNIMPGDTVRLSGTQTVLRDLVSPAVFTNPASPVVLGNCDACFGPAAIITGPVTVPDVCDASTATGQWSCLDRSCCVACGNFPVFQH